MNETTETRKWSWTTFHKGSGCSLCDITGGFVSGILGMMVGYPADTVKTRQQIFGEKSVLRVARMIHQQEGIGGFFKGMVYPTRAAGIVGSAFFGGYGLGIGIVKKIEGLPVNRSQVTVLEAAFAGMFAGVTGLVLITPIELVKIQMQTSIPSTARDAWSKGVESRHQYHESSPVLMKDIVAKHGFFALYRGIGPCFYREITANASYMGCYQYFLNTYGDIMLTHLVGGGVSGMVSEALSMPFDVLKSKIQADDINAPRRKHLYGGTWSTMKECVAEEGIGILIRGLRVTAFRAFPVTAFIILVYAATVKECRVHLGMGNCDETKVDEALQPPGRT